MRIARVAHPSGPRFAVDRHGRWVFVDDPFAAELVTTGESVDAEDALLLAPVEPRVILGMAYNGSIEHRAKPPRAFLKSARTLAGPGDAIPIDAGRGPTVVEAELGIVIGGPAHHLSTEHALDAVLGYTAANDVGTPEQSAIDGFWTQTKNGENFSPIGPWIETEFDPFDASIALRVNGESVAEASTARLARNVVEILVYVTRFVALDAGDVIMAGCAGTSSVVDPGDTIEVEIAGIGVLGNSAVARR